MKLAVFFALLSLLLASAYGACPNPTTPPPPPPDCGPGGRGTTRPPRVPVTTKPPSVPATTKPPQPPPNGVQCNTRNSPLSPADRQKILDIHNRLRSSNARGLEQDGPSGQKMAPKGKNIYKLSYSCEIEQIAQAWADNCEFEHSYRKGYGENVYQSWPAGAANDTSGLQGATDLWWGELKKVGVAQYSPDYKYTNFLHSKVVGHYTQMVWARTTEFGCGLRQCSTPKSQTIIVCNYVEQGNFRDASIYEFGEPCQRDSDCTTFPGSTCSREQGSEGLCVKH